jgi:hypothetical protein
MLLLYISFYIFKAIIFLNIDMLGFEIFKYLKMEGSLVPMWHGNDTFRHTCYNDDKKYARQQHVQCPSNQPVIFDTHDKISRLDADVYLGSDWLIGSMWPCHIYACEVHMA